MHVSHWYLTVISAFFKVSAVEFPKHFMEDNINKCLKELNHTESDLNNVMDDAYYILHNPIARSHKKCMFTRLNMLKDGKFVKEPSVDYLAAKVVPFYNPNARNHAAEAAKVYDLCVYVKGAEDGERVVNFANCVIDEIRKL
ncbi:uncharacterized protein LOC116181235 [Photinus pyralis]|uniref:uncharacterized protein LOC116178212 n=1 Tax=Photinus pyralis TaxID=7054 RepID=UPI001266EE99|nr:uncharacterized protein LOC116178212 [Photinus pyralis]XP_031357394.1 uncharacterized protein LOC116181235 [Photinus pyralis]